MKTRTFWMMAGCLLAAGCAGGGPTDAAESRDELVGAQRIELRAVSPYLINSSGMGDRARVVVRGQAEWQTVWERIWRNHMPLPATPAVDFGSEAVVVAAMGSRPTGGYTITVDSATATAEAIHVFVTEQSAGRCLVTQAFTAPVHLVAIPADGREVRFHDTAVVRDC